MTICDVRKTRHNTWVAVVIAGPWYRRRVRRAYSKWGHTWYLDSGHRLPLDVETRCGDYVDAIKTLEGVGL